jgi:chitin synthase
MKLNDVMYSPSYRCDSVDVFSVRHSFGHGEWTEYNSSAGFVAETVLQNIAVQQSSFLRDLSAVLPSLNRNLLQSKISDLCQVLENARVWTAFNLKPTSSQAAFDPSLWDVSLVSSQVRTLHLAQHHARRKSADFTSDFSIAEFFDRYSSIFPQHLDTRSLPVRECIIRFLDARKLPLGESFVGNERVWVGELGWENLEGELDDCIAGVRSSEEILARETYSAGTPGTPMNEAASGYGFYAGGTGIAESREGLLDQIQERYPREIVADDKSYYYGMDGKERLNYSGDMEAKNVEVVRTTTIRKFWVFVVWFLTWPIPGFLLRYVGRMKRKDVQMAWREKVTICFFIFLLCGTVVFYIIFFQKLLCPEFDKVRWINSHC